MKLLFSFYKIVSTGILFLMSVFLINTSFAQVTQEWEANYGNSVVPRE